MTKKRNGFLRFCCSLLPGAGEMYMGFMKMGLSLMSMFFGIIVAASIFELGPLAVLAVIAVLQLLSCTQFSRLIR